MNKIALVKTLAAVSGVSQDDCSAVLAAFTNVVARTLEDRGKIAIKGFGTFETKKRAARTGRNLKTNDIVRIPESYAPVFRPSQVLKDVVNS